MNEVNELAITMREDTFVATDGWLTRWKKRHGVVYKKIYWEEANTDMEGATYGMNENSNIYNFDESGLYYRAIPDYCMALKKDPQSQYGRDS